MVDTRILTATEATISVPLKRRPTVVASRPGDPPPTGSGEGVSVRVVDERTPIRVQPQISVPPVPSFPENASGCYPATYETQLASLNKCKPQAIFVDAPCSDESNRCHLIRGDVFDSQREYLRGMLASADDIQRSKNLALIAQWSRNVCISVSTALNALNARFMTARHTVTSVEYACATLGIEGGAKESLMSAADIDSFPTVTALRRTLQSGARSATGDAGLFATPLMMPTLNDVVAGVTYSSPSQPVGPSGKMGRTQWGQTLRRTPIEIAQETWKWGIYGGSAIESRSLGPDLIQVRRYKRYGCAWNEPCPALGQEKAVYGPLRQIEYCKTWIRAILSMDPYRYSQQAMQRWTASMQPWVAAGLLSADALTISEDAAQAVYDYRKDAAGSDFRAAGAVGGSVGAVASAIPGGQAIGAVVGLLSALISLLPGAVGGYACPQLPVLRILRETDCPTSRLVLPSDVTPSETQTATSARVSGSSIALWGIGGAVVGYLLLEGLGRK